MAKKKLKNQNEPGFIPGIYNYCDRWCEKCALQLRCISFVMGKRMEERGEFGGELGEMKSDEMWKRLKSIFESAYEVLQELAEERGMKVKDICIAEQIDKDFWIGGGIPVFRKDKLYSRTEDSDVLRICRIYEYWADRCLENMLKLADKAKEVSADDLEIVNWYVDLMYMKMRQSLYAYTVYQEEGGSMDECNGLTKVALIAIERSVAGWRNIRESYAGDTAEIGHLLVILEQLRTDIERHFPDAREFQRPGFEKCVD